MSKRDNKVGDIRRIPVPATVDTTNVENAVKAYLNAADNRKQASLLRDLMLQIDVEILKLYALPLEEEWAILRLFNGCERFGVPFSQIGYFPEELEHPIRLADFLEFESDWSLTNRERGRLIDKDIAGTISVEEKTRLEALQAYADYYLDKVSPRPTHILDELEGRLFGNSTTNDKEE
jgi:hypothetical protein